MRGLPADLFADPESAKDADAGAVVEAALEVALGGRYFGSSLALGGSGGGVFNRRCLASSNATISLTSSTRRWGSCSTAARAQSSFQRSVFSWMRTFPG